MIKVYFNGELYAADGPVLPLSNRGFHYADGFFETIRLINGKPVFLENHFSRILDTLKAYRIAKPSYFDVKFIEDTLQGLAVENGVTQGGRARLTFTRKGDGYYLPKSDDLDLAIELTPFHSNKFILNENGKNVDLCVDHKKDVNKLAIFKSLNCQVYIQASLFANEKGLDDALIQNYRGSIIEATSSNIFLVSNGVLYTSGLEDGPVAGTMRMQVINLALENGIKVYECTLTPQNLLAADELFMTNAIQGIQWVSSYRTKRYFNDMAVRLVEMLNKRVFA